MIITQNKKAYHDYNIIEEFEAGIELVGPEVKSLRMHRVDINQGFVKLENGEAFLYNSHINPYKNTHNYEYDPKRRRRLLLKRRQLKYMTKKIEEKGLTIIPVQIYFKKSWAKVKIALAKGKSKYDKRDTLKKRIIQREIDREHSLEKKKYI